MRMHKILLAVVAGSLFAGCAGAPTKPAEPVGMVKVREETAEELFSKPRHPYTHGLLGSVPRLDSGRGERLHAIRGSVRDVLPWPDGCAFAPRCDRQVDACVGEPPALVEGIHRHAYRCVNPEPATAEVSS